MNNAWGRTLAAKGPQIVLIVVAVVAGVVIWLIQHNLDHTAAEKPSSPLVNFLSDDDDREFAPVQPGYAFRFPQDHGAHPGFRQEWWYFTGNLQDANGREFGFQLTFFRFAGSSFEELGQNPWNSGQTWMAHFAVTDVDARRFYEAEDFSRDAISLAGAQSAPFAVWLNGWSARQRQASCDGCMNAVLAATADNFSISLRVNSLRQPVLHGNSGYSTKNKDGSIASYYYSVPDLVTEGHIEINGKRYQVAGNTWMDHEWSSTVLGKNQSGWDWFALHFDNGAKLMMFQVRARNGSAYQSGVLVLSDGSIKKFDIENLSMLPLEFWSSAATGNQYPLKWKLGVDSSNTQLRISVIPAVREQELNLAFTYYEGVIRFSGSLNGERVAGVGYMELVGYDQ